MNHSDLPMGDEEDPLVVDLLTTTLEEPLSLQENDIVFQKLSYRIFMCDDKNICIM